MTNIKTLFAAALTSLVFVGAGCAPAPETTTERPTSGPFASVSTEKKETGEVTVILATRANAKAADFYDASKLPMAGETFYSDNPLQGLGEPFKTYDDEDGDANRLYKVTGGALATIEMDGDPLSIVEYRPDALMAADFLNADVMKYVPVVGDVFLIVQNQETKEDILFLVEVKDGKVLTVSP